VVKKYQVRQKTVTWHLYHLLWSTCAAVLSTVVLWVLGLRGQHFGVDLSACKPFPAVRSASATAAAGTSSEQVGGTVLRPSSLR
jgi:hypothetical protein